MSYKEYNDLLLKCQLSGKYRVFTFDLIDSSKCDTIAYQNSLILIERIYQDILMLGKALNKKILINDKYSSMLEISKNKGSFEVPYDWFIIGGDTVGLTIYNNSIPSGIIYKIFELNVNEMGLQNCYHVYDLVYETNKYSEGNNKYFRGYAIAMCANMHKENQKELRTTLDKLKDSPSVEEVNIYMSIISENHNIAIQRATKRLEEWNIKKIYTYYKCKGETI